MIEGPDMPTTPATPFTVEQRRRLLDEYFALLPDGAQGARLATLAGDYIAGLPRIALSRDPLGGGVVTHSLDPFGLDGLWWDYEKRVRPDDEGLPASVFAVTGALHLGGPPEPAPFLCKPGPEAPFVIPRMLSHPAMVAVVSHVRVGAHDGYPILYYADPVPSDVGRFNTWGTDMYWYRDTTGEWVWNSVYEDTETLDFDLVPWLQSGRLRWVAPGDAGLELREGVDDCPYLGIGGRREFYRVRRGRVW